MKKLIGLFLFLVLLYVALFNADVTARSADNHYNLAKRIGLFGILCLGVAPLIISGGIDLSIGAVVGLCVTVLAIQLQTLTWFGEMLQKYPAGSAELTALIEDLTKRERSIAWESFVQNYRWIVDTLVWIGPTLPILLTLLLGALIGFLNGFFVTRFRLQPFVVTLCGLFIYRGLARWLAKDEVKGLGTSYSDLKDVFYAKPLFSWDMFEETWRFPKFLLIFLILAGLMAVFLHLSVYGRYLFAIGANEKTARYSGIAVDRYKILAYVICSTIAAWFSVLFLMEYNSATPSETGNFFELYAIAGAVLGGVSLRGGEGHLFGILIGATILQILPNLTNMWGIQDSFKPAVIGGALLLGTMADELLRRRTK